ncbi:MAG: hypothetical protein WDN10_01510 [bacterium]
MDFTGSIVPEICQHCACGWGGFFAVVQNLLKFGLYLAVFFAVLLLVYAGFLFVTNAASPDNVKQARTVVLQTVIGLLVVLGAWLIVNTVMNALYNGTFGPWNAIISGGEAACLELSTPRAPVTATNVSATPSSGNSSCKVPSNANNPCSVQGLQGTCFAANGEVASKVCNLESAGGQTAIPSGSDKLDKGKGPSYSWGLWQINLTTTKLGSLNCPAAFTHPCSGQYIRNQGKVGWCDSSVKDQNLYTQCVRAAQDPKINTQAACGLYTPTMSAWACSASRCGVPGAKTLSGVCAPGG